MSSSPQVSEELRNVLENYVFEVLKTQPSDFYKFSRDYFVELYEKNKSPEQSATNGYSEKSDAVALMKTQEKSEVKAPSPLPEPMAVQSEENKGADLLMKTPSPLPEPTEVQSEEKRGVEVLMKTPSPVPQPTPVQSEEKWETEALMKSSSPLPQATAIQSEENWEAEVPVKTPSPLPPATTTKSQEPLKHQPEDDEEDDDVMDMPDIRSRYTNKSARRQSVAAESFDPEKIDYSEIKVYEKTDAQKSRLKEAVKDIFIFRSLQQNQLPRLIDAMFERTVQPEEVVIKQGDDGDNFYIIESGLFDIIKDGANVGNYNNRGSFGELALMYNCPRAATIVAKTAGILWAMDRESFLKIVLHAAFKKRQIYEELLASANILAPLTDYERTNLADALCSREYEDGEEICHEGDEGNEMYFVENGEVVVLSSRGSDGTETELRKIVKGGYFGELALLTDGHRNATIRAVNNVRLAVLDRNSFERLMGPCVDLMKGQGKAYQEDIIARLGQDALAKYPGLIKLLESAEVVSPAQTPNTNTDAQPEE